MNSKLNKALVQEKKMNYMKYEDNRIKETSNKNINAQEQTKRVIKYSDYMHKRKEQGALDERR